MRLFRSWLRSDAGGCEPFESTEYARTDSKCGSCRDDPSCGDGPPANGTTSRFEIKGEMRQTEGSGVAVKAHVMSGSMQIRLEVEEAEPPSGRVDTEDETVASFARRLGLLDALRD